VTFQARPQQAPGERWSFQNEGLSAGPCHDAIHSSRPQTSHKSFQQMKLQAGCAAFKRTHNAQMSFKRGFCAFILCSSKPYKLDLSRPSRHRRQNLPRISRDQSDPPEWRYTSSVPIQNQESQKKARLLLRFPAAP
jgi:hypothetical protein